MADYRRTNGLMRNAYFLPEKYRMKPHSTVSVLVERCRRYKKKVRVVICLVLVLCLRLLLWSNCPTEEQTDYVRQFPSRQFSNTSHKTILLWAPLFESETWYVPDFKLPLCTQLLPKTCELTRDRSLLEKSDAVVFNNEDTRTIPRRTRTDQIWVYFNMEALPNVKMDFSRFNGLFNWTTSFRRDSTVPMSYGSFGRKLKRIDKTPDAFSEKSKMAYWAASNCLDSNQRYKLVYELQKYLRVDTYGKCGTMECPLSQDACFKPFSQYKFSLALENSYCKDYVTEKFWNSLRRRQIPLVYGGANYANIAPPNSYIDVEHFEDIAELAAYVKEVANNKTLYNSYFEWMRDFDVEPCLPVDRSRNCFPTESYFCTLCGALHNTSIPAQVYSDLYGWITDELPRCKEYSFFRDRINRLSRCAFELGI